MALQPETSLESQALAKVTPVIKVGEYEVAWEHTRGGWIYIHDMTVQLWPGEDQTDPRYGRTFIYGSYWEAGLRIADVTDVPHPVNSPEEYAVHATLCKTGVGNLYNVVGGRRSRYVDGLLRYG